MPDPAKLKQYGIRVKKDKPVVKADTISPSVQELLEKQVFEQTGLGRFGATSNAQSITTPSPITTGTPKALWPGISSFFGVDYAS